MHTTRLLPRAICALFAVALAASASAQMTSGNITLSGNNRVSSLSAPTVSLGGLSFTNNGLVGVGRVSASAVDAWGESLGSVSALQLQNFAYNSGSGNYSGTFYTLPDRGYNAGTTFSNYAARIQAFDFSFTPNLNFTAGVGSAQNQITLTYNGTNSTKFTYDSGGGNYVTTTGLVPTGSTTFAGATVPYVGNSNGTPTGTTGAVAINRISLDSEGLVLKPDGSGYVSDEYGAYIYQFNSQKQITAVIAPPGATRPSTGATSGTAGGTTNFSSEVSNTNGRRGNQGLEGIALSGDGTKLYALMQSGLVQDSGSGNQGRFNTRMFVYNTSDHSLAAEYVLQLPILNDTGTGSPNRTAAQSEIVYIDANHILVLSRDGNGKGATASGQPVFKSALLVDLSMATNIAGLYDADGNKIITSTSGSGVPVLNPAITPVSWTEAVNMLNSAQLAVYGLNLNAGSAADANTLSEKWEGMTIVADPNGAPGTYFLFIANDNDFLSTNTLMAGLDGIVPGTGINTGVTNDTMFLAYSVTLGATAVPEPSTYAALAGLGALGFAFWRRRRAQRAA